MVTRSTGKAAPIPSLFCHSDTGKPFSTCLICHATLANASYMVQKVIRNHLTLATKEVLFEYAVCLSCANTMQQELSKASARKINDYFSSRIKLVKKRKDTPPPTTNADMLSSRIDRCLIKQTPIKNASIYTACALCHSNIILYADLPYALCGEALDEIDSLLSATTRDTSNNFTEQYFAGPSEVMDILKGTSVLF